MKKYLKLCLAFVLSLVICLSFCSCNALDELRAAQAFFDKEGNIIYKGNTYVKFDNLNSDVSAVIPYYNEIYITKPDVPLLLSTVIKEGQGWINESCTLIEISDYESNYYILESKIDEYDKILKNLEFTDMYFEYVSVDDDGYKYELVSDRVKTAINRALKENKLSKYSLYDCYNSFYLYECDKQITFSGREYAVAVFSTDDTNENFEFAVSVDEETQSCYKIPDEYQKDFKQLYDKKEAYWTNDYENYEYYDDSDSYYF